MKNNSHKILSCPKHNICVTLLTTRKPTIQVKEECFIPLLEKLLDKYLRIIVTQIVYTFAICRQKIYFCISVTPFQVRQMYFNFTKHIPYHYISFSFHIKTFREHKQFHICNKKPWAIISLMILCATGGASSILFNHEFS